MSQNPPSLTTDPPTSPTLLTRLKVWDDRTAWNRFFNEYSPLFDRWSRSRLRDSADIQEVNQLVWWELARRLVDFQYDPAKSFRGWLRTLHSSRMLDFLKSEQGRRNRDLKFHQQRGASTFEVGDRGIEDGTFSVTPNPGHQIQQSLALEIQRRVRSRVSERTWSVFWEIAVDGQTIADTAQRYSMRYASAFAAFTRVKQMLQNEAALETGR